MADRSVVVRLRAEVDQFVAGTQKAKREMQGFGKEVAGQGKAASADIERIGTGAMVAGAAIAVGFGHAAFTAANFEKEMSGVKAVSGASADEMNRLSDAALAAGASQQLAGVTASDAARAEAELVKAGISVNDVLGGALMGSLTLASAGQLDFAKSAEIAAQAMNIFDLSGRDVGHVADVLAAAANKSAGDVTQFGDALRQGGLVAAQTDLSLEETVGTLAAFADNALIGSDAGTSLKTMLQRLTPQSEEAARLMDELGFSAYDAQGNFIGVERLAGELQEALGDMTVEQRNATMATLFGSDAVRGANILYEQGAEGIKGYVDAVDDQGAAARMAAEQNNNLKGDIEALGGAFESALIENGSKATGVLRGLTQTATDVVGGFSAMPDLMQTVTVGLSGVVGAASLVGGGFVTLAPKIKASQDALNAMDSSVANFAGRNMGKIAGGVAALGAAVAVGAWAYGQATKSSREYSATVDQLAASLAPVVEGQVDLNDALSDFLEMQSAGLSTDQIAIMNQLKISLEDVEDAIIAGGDALDPFREQVEALGVDLDGLDIGQLDDAGAEQQLSRLAAAMGISADELRGLIDAVEDWDNAAQDSAQKTVEAAVAQGDFKQSAVDAAIAANTLADGTINYAGVLADLAPLLPETKAGLDEVTGGLTAGEEAAKEAQEAFESLMDAYRGAVDPLFGMLDAIDANREAQTALTEALALNSDGIADNEKSAAELDAMYREVASTALDVEVAAATLNQEIANGNVTLEQAQAMLHDWVQAGLITEDQAAQVAAQFGNAADQGARIAPEYKTKVTADTVAAEQALARVVAWQQAIRGSIIARVQVQLDNPYRTVPGFQIASGGLVPQYLAGGGISVGPMFQPHGTDTVPAMLTPGEFVMQKSAVDRYGTAYMEALNAGTIGAASGQTVVVHNNQQISVGAGADARQLATVVRDAIEVGTRRGIRSAR